MDQRTTQRLTQKSDGGLDEGLDEGSLSRALWKGDQYSVTSIDINRHYIDNFTNSNFSSAVSIESQAFFV